MTTQTQSKLQTQEDSFYAVWGHVLQEISNLGNYKFS